MLTCVIVDAYGPGMFFVEKMKQRGCDVVHIQSSKIVPPPFAAFIENAGFVEKIIYENDVEAIVASLKKYTSIECIIPGFETGVLLADILSEALDIKSNGVALSAARRSKFEMMEALKAKQVPTVKYIKTHKAQIAIDWLNAETHYPVVAKPIDSASSEDVYICDNANDLEAAFDKMLNKKNMMGSENNEIIVQAYLEGTEYVVNSVSCAGKHYISDMWICKKRKVDNRVIYDKEELIPFDGDAQALIVPYINNVLDALGIKYGPAHSEVMLTKSGPILIETGARVDGAANPPINNDCFGASQIDLTVDAYLDHQRFESQRRVPYQLKKYLYVVMAISNKDGIIKDIPLFNNIKKLSTVCHVRFKKKVGDRLHKTIDLNTSPAMLYMASENKAELENEYNILLSLYDEGFSLEAN